MESNNLELVNNENLNNKIQHLMMKYDVSMIFMMLISSLDNFTKDEIYDVDYLEDRIQTHLENFTGTEVLENSNNDKFYTNINEFKKSLNKSKMIKENR